MRCEKWTIYKVKENQKVDETEEFFSKYICVYEFVTEVETGQIYVMFDYVYIDTLEPTSRLTFPKVIKLENFEKKFDTYKSYNDVKKEIEGEL